MWDSRTYSAAGRIENAHDNKIYAVKYANDTTLISTGRDGAIKVWDLRNIRKAKSVIEDGKVYKSLDCRSPLVVAGSMDSHVKVFNQDTGSVEYKTDLAVDMSVFTADSFFFDPPTVVQSVRFCNANLDQLLTAHDDYSVRDLHMSQFGFNEMNVCRQHLASVRHIELSADDSMFVTTAANGTVRLWNFEFMRTYMSLVGNSQIVVRTMQPCSAMTRDCRTVVTCSYDQQIRLYRLP
jgi:WD40 repeat protein